MNSADLEITEATVNQKPATVAFDEKLEEVSLSFRNKI